MASHHINFTKAALLKIVPPLKPDDKRGGVFDTYYDTNEKGLALLVSNGGAKTFYVYSRVNGRPQRIKLGGFPDLTIENARKKALLVKGQIIDGKDPVEERKRKLTEGSLAKFFYGQYLDRHAKKHNRAWKQEESRFERLLKPLHNRQLSTIKRSDIEALHGRIKKEQGKYAANRCLALVHSVFNKAIEWGWQGINPAHGIRKFEERSRERFLLPEELPSFFAALDAEDNKDMRDYFLMLLLTGARRRNVAAMHWQDISLELRQWAIPETKNGESYTVNLPKEAVEILKKRQKKHRAGYVFPSSNSKAGYLQEPKAAWKRILQRAGIEDLRIHDLRRTLGSYQAIGGASSFIIGKSLGHKSSAATEIYARLNADPVRESVEKATQQIMKLRG